MIKRIGFIIAGLLMVVFGIMWLMDYKESSDYISELEAARQDKEIWMSTSLESPFVLQQVTFENLKYFEPNEKFKIEAEFERSEEKQEVTLVTNDGKERVYEMYGEATFTIDGIPCSLNILSSEAELGTVMFVPFMDATSGEETYGAGRYLEADLPLTNKILLDFNEAYNPYCAYMEGFTCPFPPKSNKLQVAVLAGEKAY